MMRWIAEWFTATQKRIIEADTLDDADEQAYRLVGRYPDSLRPEQDPEAWVRTYNGMNPVRLPNSPLPYEDYHNGYGEWVSTTFMPRIEYSQNIEDYQWNAND